MRYLDSISGLILFLFGLTICLISRSYPLGSLHAPGPGLFPLLASILLMAFSSMLVIQPLLKKKGAESSKALFFPGKEAPWRILLAFVSLVAYRYLLPFIGFGPCTFVFFLLLVKRLGHYQWKVSLLFSILAALGAYFLFQVWLEVQMPIGIFGI
jgi:putative tricarboxylic transport membrane protein